MTRPTAVEWSDEVDVLYIRYADGDVARTVAIDADGELLADLAADGSVLGIECLMIDESLRADLGAFAEGHSLQLPPDVDTFAS
jgi:uncharacterized protein YuzE